MNSTTDRGHREALVQLARNLAATRGKLVREVWDWPGCDGSVHDICHSLVQHLLAPYPLPRFLAFSWLLPPTPDARRQQWWAAAYARGTRWRDMSDLPVTLTRRMEHLLLQSADHLNVYQAVRRAELLGLGANDMLTESVMGTKLATTLHDGDTWRPILHWLVVHQDTLSPREVVSIVNFLRWANAPENGPGFLLDGRTPLSLLRLVAEWDRFRRMPHAGLLMWAPSPYRGWRWTELEAASELEDGRSGDSITWEFVELTNSAQLRAEGQAMRHCVGGYAGRCRHGKTRIWSLRRSVNASVVQSQVTIALDLSREAIVEAKGFRNRRLTAIEANHLTAWAKREGLAIKL